MSHDNDQFEKSKKMTLERIGATDLFERVFIEAYHAGRQSLYDELYAQKEAILKLLDKKEKTDG